MEGDEKKYSGFLGGGLRSRKTALKNVEVRLVLLSSLPRGLSGLGYW